MTTAEKETRVLEYLEGDLAPEDEQVLLADAARDPELAAILEEYRRQDRLLHAFHDAQAADADAVRRPDLSSLPAAVEMPRRVPAMIRWMAAAAVLTLIAGSTAVLMRADSGGAVGTVAHATGAVRAYHDGETIDLADQSLITSDFERIKTPPGSSLEVSLANGGSLELNESSTVRLAMKNDRPEVELNNGEVFVHGASLTVSTPWFAAESDNASFGVVRGLRGAEVAVARGTVEVRQDGTRRSVEAGEAWSSSGGAATPVARRLAWSRRAEELGGLIAATPVIVAARPEIGPPIEVAMAASIDVVSAGPEAVKTGVAKSVAPLTTSYLPAGTVGFVEIPSVTTLLGNHDLSDAFLGDRLRTMIHDGIDRVQASAESRERMHRDVNELFDDADLNLVLSSLGGGLSAGVTKKGPMVIAEVTANRAAVETLINKTLPARMQASGAGDHLFPAVSQGLLVIGLSREEFEGTMNAVRSGMPTEFAGSAFLQEVRAAAGAGGPFIAASDIQAIVRGEADSRQGTLFFRRMGWENLRSVIVSPTFSDDADNRGLQMRFDGPRAGVMAWLDRPGPMSGFEFFSPDTHVLTAARIQSPMEMLHEVLTWQMEDSDLEVEKLESDEGYLLLNAFASSLGNEVVIGMDNPVLPIPNVKLVVELADPAAFHDGMLELVEYLSSQPADATEILMDASTYRNHLIVDLRIPGKVVGVSYAVVDDYAVFGPGRPFLQAAIDTFVDRRSIDREPAFIEALPAKSGSNVSWLLFVASNDSLSAAGPYLAQNFVRHGAPVDLAPVFDAAQGRSVVMYAIADEDRIDYYIEGIKGEFEMTGFLPAVTQWLAENGS